MSALQKILDEFAGLGAADVARQAAAAALRAHGLPGRGEENWRYANLRALEGVRSFLPAASPAATAALSLPPPLPGYARVLLVDGRLQGDWASDQRLAGVVAAGTGAAAGDLPPGSAPRGDWAGGIPADFAAAGDGRLGLIATLFAPEPLTLRIAKDLALEVISVSTAAAGAVHVCLDIRVASGVRLDLVERHEGVTGGQGLTCVQLQVQLAAGAVLAHQRLLAAAGDAVFIDTLAAQLAERARYEVNQVSVGAATARSSAQVRLLGRDASLQWQALSAANGRQVNDALLSVRHEAPGTSTAQLFRGIASDSARVACNGDMYVAATAPGTKVVQSLRGLIDGAAEVDLRPRLTIHTDDIKASHGATTGRLDENLLFYLLSRGLGADEARSLLKWAFLGEVLKSIEPAPLRRTAEQAAAARLSDAPAAELLQ